MLKRQEDRIIVLVLFLISIGAWVWAIFENGDTELLSVVMMIFFLGISILAAILSEHKHIK